MLQLHAVIAARLMPVALGPGAIAAVAAYAQAACGTRLSILHVSPGFIHPRDIDSAPELLAAAAAAKDIDGLSLLLLEGANRCPLEASVVPLLQVGEAGLAPVAPWTGFRLAATLVAGATTVPVSPQLWSHAVALYPEPRPVIQQAAAPPGDVSLSGALMALGDVPNTEIDELIGAWPDCSELRPVLERFGAALARFYSEPSRLRGALLEGVVLPYLVTTLGAEEQEDALSKLLRESDAALIEVTKRLRRRLC
jgi:hypothetical protein